MLKNKAMTTMIAFILMLTIAMPIVALPSAAALEYDMTKDTYALIGATPNPIGVGQETLLWVGISDMLRTAAHGWEGLTVTVTRPDGTTETLGPFKTDSTGSTGTVYVPTMVGNYTLQTHFPEQIYNWPTRSDWSPGLLGDVLYKDSDSKKLTLVVQEEPVPYYPGVPLPTEYWTRPIDAQLYEWHAISGNWVATPRNLYAPYNEGPETAHILWAKQLAAGGLAGELMGGDNAAHSYDCGDAYVGKFASSVIIGGVLYYNRYEARGQPYAGDVDVVAVDLKTGEELWANPLVGRTGTTTGATVAAANRVIDGVSEQFPNGIGRRLAFGQVFYWDSYNLHGVYGLLWTTVGTTWMAFDAFTGRWIYTITNVPGGETIRGTNGEIYRLQVNVGQGWMALWNSSALVSMQGSWNPHGNVYNASGRTAAGAMPSSVARAWVYNVTISTSLPFQAVWPYTSDVSAVLEDRVIGTTAGGWQSAGFKPIVTWALSLKPGQEGQLLFNKTWTPPKADLTITLGAQSLEDKVFVMRSKETRQWWGFSLDTGDRIWGPTQSEGDLGIFGMTSVIAYGKLFSTGMNGVVYAYDVKTGTLLWSYEAYDPLNEILWSNDWPTFPLFITDGKIYLGHYEHSPIDPKPRGAPFICLDVETGHEIFRVDGLFRQTNWGGRAVFGDSVIATMDTYDQRIYAIGKGPSATTVSAPDISVDLGKSLVIKGSVIDVSPGTKDSTLIMRFPNGVAAVADEYMSEWMLYVYKQFPRPTDATGVEVTIDVIDTNGNYRNIGTTTSDSSGKYGFSWTPDISGDYTVIATFAGSKAYYPSYDVTYFAVDEAPEGAPDPTPPSASVADVYFVPAVAGMIIAIIVGFALVLLMLRKRP